MNNKLINRQIRSVSNFSSLPILIFLILTEVFSIAFALVSRELTRRGISLDSDVVVLISYCIQYLVITALAIAVFYLTRRRSTGLTLSAAFRKPQKSFGFMAKWFVITSGLAYTASYATSFFQYFVEKALGSELSEPSFDFGDSALGVFSMVFSTVILAPIFEELLFRGTFYRSSEVMGQFFAIVLTGFYFGIWHMNFRQFLFAAVIGACAAYVYSQTRSVFPCIIYHMLINGISVFVSFFTGGLDADIESVSQATRLIQENPSSIIVIMVFGLYVLAVIHASIPLLVIELIKNKRQSVLRKSVFPYSGVRRALVFFSAPVTIITLLIMLAGTVIRAIPK